MTTFILFARKRQKEPKNAEQPAFYVSRDGKNHANAEIMNHNARREGIRLANIMLLFKTLLFFFWHSRQKNFFLKIV